MRKPIAALLLLLASVSAALAQQVLAPSGTTAIICAYNSIPPSVASGFFGYVQCGPTGQLVSIGVEQPDVTGTFTNATQTTSITSTSQDGYGTVLVSISGTYGTASGVFELSDDGGTTWFPMAVTRSDGSGAETNYTALTNISRAWIIPVAAMDLIRIRSTAVASGTVNIRMSSTSVQTSPIPAVTAVAAKTTYLCGFTITSDATAAIAGTATVAGTIGGTMSYIQNVGSATAAGMLTQSFVPCIPGSAVNTAIVITSVAAGTGGSTAVTAWGYQQ